MRGEKKVFLAVFTVCFKFLQREIVLSNLNKRLNTEDNLPDDTQMLQSVVFMLQLYCFPLGDHWTVTRDHVRFKGGLEPSSNSWLSHLGAKCLGLLSSVALHPDPKQHGFIPRLLSLDNTQPNTVRRRPTSRLSGGCCFQTETELNLSAHESRGNAVTFLCTYSTISSSDSSGSLRKKPLWVSYYDNHNLSTDLSEQSV